MSQTYFNILDLIVRIYFLFLYVTRSVISVFNSSIILDQNIEFICILFSDLNWIRNVKSGDFVLM